MVHDTVILITADQYSKSYIYQTVPLSTTLNEFQGHPIICCWLSQKRLKIRP